MFLLHRQAGRQADKHFWIGFYSAVIITFYYAIPWADRLKFNTQTQTADFNQGKSCGGGRALPQQYRTPNEITVLPSHYTELVENETENEMSDFMLERLKVKIHMAINMDFWATNQENLKVFHFFFLFSLLLSVVCVCGWAVGLVGPQFASNNWVINCRLTQCV